MSMVTLDVIAETLAAWQVFYIKEHLKSVGWTVQSSSDGTTYNSSGDQITHGNAGAGGLGNTNAWFRMRIPVGAIEISIQRTVNNSTHRVKIARAAMNAGSPGATQTPTTTTASDEIVILGAGTDAAPTGASMGFGGGSNGGQHLKGAADDEAPYGFWFACSVVSQTGTLQPGSLIFDPLTNTIPGDAFPYVILAKANDLQTTVLSVDAAGSQFTYLASATPSTSINASAVDFYGGSNLVVPGDIMSTNDGQFRKFPVCYERRAAVANPGYKGISTMMKWISPKPARWTTVSIDSSNDHIVYGEVALVWGGERARV